MGFKTGYVTPISGSGYGVSVTLNSLKRIGNVVVGRFKGILSGNSLPGSLTIAQLPNYFKPSSEISIFPVGLKLTSSGTKVDYVVTLNIRTDGSMVLSGLTNLPSGGAGLYFDFMLGFDAPAAV